MSKPRPRLTSDQFDALAQLLRLRESPSREVARLMLVDGLDAAEAAQRGGIVKYAAYKVYYSCLRGLALVQTIAGRE